MKPTFLLRIASVLTLIHSALHTIGGVFGKPAPGIGAATFTVMQANYFHVLGVTRSYAEFYRGLGLAVTIALTAEGLLFWLLGSLAQKHPSSCARFSGSSRWPTWSLLSTPTRIFLTVR